VAVTIISMLAFGGMLFFPVVKSVKFRLTMQFFIALGVGTLSGDAIFHIFPDVRKFIAYRYGRSLSWKIKINLYVV